MSSPLKGFGVPAPDPLMLRAPARWKTLLSYAGLVFFSACLALFMAEATDPLRGFLPVVLDPPPAHSAPRGFEASFGVSRLYARSTVEIPRPLVANSGDYYRFPAQEGLASWYGYDHIGRKTADGGWFDPEAMTAAHRSLPFGSIVRVTRLSTGRTVEVTINDRGPYIEGRVIDLSRRAAAELGIREHGLARCRVEVLRYPYDGPSLSAPAPEPPPAPLAGTLRQVSAAPDAPALSLESPPPPAPLSDPVSVSTSVSRSLMPEASRLAAPPKPLPRRVPVKRAEPALKAILSDAPVLPPGAPGPADSPSAPAP